MLYTLLLFFTQAFSDGGLFDVNKHTNMYSHMHKNNKNCFRFTILERETIMNLKKGHLDANL